MKKLYLLLILCVFPLISKAEINLIASTCFKGANNDTVTSSAINTVGATLIVISGGYYPPAGGLTVSDSNLNTWTSLSAYAQSTNQAVRLHYVSSPATGSSHTFTLADTDGYPDGCVMAFSGVASTSPFSTQTGAVAATATSLSPGNASSSVATLVIATVANVDNVSSMSVNNSFLGQISSDSTAFVPSRVTMAYKIGTLPLSETPTFSWTTARNSASALATFIAEAEAEEENPTSTTTINVDFEETNKLIGSVAYGLAVVITIMFIGVIGYVYNKITRKKPWQ